MNKFYILIYEKIKNVLPYISLVLSIIIFGTSFYFLYMTYNQNTSITNKQIKQDARYIYNLIKQNNLHFYKEPPEIKNFSDLSLKSLFSIQKQTNSAYITDCDTLSDKSEEKYSCQYHFFYHKYSDLLNQKGIIDYSICGQIKDVFGTKSFLAERCNFIYGVDAGTKFLTTKPCDVISLEGVTPTLSRDKCVKNIIYSIHGDDDTIGVYLETTIKRNELSQSSIGNQILNKYGMYHKGKAEGADFYKLSLDEYLKGKLVDYNNLKKSTQNEMTNNINKK